jgi:hypothetical protein
MAQCSLQRQAGNENQCYLSSGHSPKPVGKVQARNFDPNTFGYFRFSGQGALGRKLRFQIFKERVPSHMVTIGLLARRANRRRIFPVMIGQSPLSVLRMSKHHQMTSNSIKEPEGKE